MHKNTWTATHNDTTIRDITTVNLRLGLRSVLHKGVYFASCVRAAAHLGVPLDTVLQDIVHAVDAINSSVYNDALLDSGDT